MRRAILRRGQSLVDLTLIIGVVGLVFIGMETYIKRSVQRKIKGLTDYIISDQQSAQYDDGSAADTNTSFSLDSTMISEEKSGGGRSLIGNEHSTFIYNTTSTKNNTIN